MDWDLGIIGAVLRHPESYSAVKQRGIDASMLEGVAARNGWSFIDKHVLEYGVVPSVELFQVSLGFPVLEPKDSINVYIDKILDRQLWNQLRGVHEKSGQLIEQRELKETLALYREALEQSIKVSGTRVLNMLSMGEDVLALYDRMKAGLRGIPSPWEAMDEVTLGWWPGDFIVFAARTSLGKTWLMLMLARHAWMEGYKVLFIGTEMATIRLAVRFYAIHFKLPYNPFRRGELDMFLEERFRKQITELSTSEGFHIIGDDFNPTIEDVNSAVEEVKPDMLFVDGVYLIKNKGTDRTTMVANTADDLKRMAKRKQVAVAASMQFNRQAKSDDLETIDIGNLGLSDVLGWNSDVAYGMYQTADMDEDKTMGWRPIKVREGKARDHFTHWNFDEMNFEQKSVADVPASAGGSRGGEDYDSIPEDTTWDESPSDKPRKTNRFDKPDDGELF